MGYNDNLSTNSSYGGGSYTVNGSSKPSTSTSSSGGGGSSSNGGLIPTTGLTGYALTYANQYNNALKGGTTMTQAQQAAESAANSYGGSSQYQSSPNISSILPSQPSNNLSLRDYLSGQGLTPSWNASNPDYVGIGSQGYKVGSIPGTYYDPTTSTHYVTDPNSLSRALGLSSVIPETKPIENPLIPPVPKFDPLQQLQYQPWQPISGLQLSSGGDTIIPTLAGQQNWNSMQDNLFSRNLSLQKLEMEKVAAAQKAETEKNKVENQPWYNDMWKAKTQADIDKIIRDSKAPYPASSTGGVTPYQDYQIGRNDQKDMADIYAKARELTNKDERVTDDPSKTNWVYEAYVKQLTQERYGLPTGNPQ